MLRSWHNFFFVAADPNGLITVDKPPLGLWLQALSAKIFGFAPLSLLVPEGVCALLAVALLYFIVAPRFGKVGGARERPRAGGVPVVRRGLARQRRRSAADPADARRLRRRARRDREGQPLAAGRLRRADRPRVQHEGARRAAVRARDRGSPTSPARPARSAGGSRTWPSPASSRSRCARRGRWPSTSRRPRSGRSSAAPPTTPRRS